MTDTTPPASARHHREPAPRGTSRRGFLGGLTAAGLGAAAVGAAGGLLLGPRAAWAGRPRELAFKNLHTGETLQSVYWADGGYRPEALREINHLLRDWRTGEVAEMDADLLDLLHDLRRSLDSRAPFQVISGYRSPKTNAKLAANSNGVAKKSLHMRGMAVDIALPDRDLVGLRETAWALQRGGVGYYGKSGFVHVDTGRVRRWNF